MSSNNSNNGGSGGIGFIGLLTIVFIVLKLLGKITWSWVWVLSPMWISAIVLFIIIIVFCERLVFAFFPGEVVVKLVRIVNNTFFFIPAHTLSHSQVCRSETIPRRLT